LRRHWHPIAAVTEFEETKIKPVRLMGEDLVLYQDRSGTFGLVDRHCPHRRADVSYGWVEEKGIRCSYHGWAFDEKGNCISQPYDDVVKGENNRRFRETCKITSYPVREMAGMIFAYLGPLPAPELPRWETFDYENGFVHIVFSDIPCNWLQAVDNNLDPVHFEWMHENWSKQQRGDTSNSAPKHLSIEIDEYEYGLGYRRKRENIPDNNPFIRYARLHLMPNIFCPSGHHFEYRVPVDDHNTLSITWFWQAVPVEQRPYVQTRIPHWYAPIKNPETGRWITTHILNQDIVGWVGQGVISDRTKEHLSSSDVGIIALRKRLIADLEAIEKGQDPSGVIRDPEKAKIGWPDDRRSYLQEEMTVEEWISKNKARGIDLADPDADFFLWHAGMPRHIKEQYLEAMGVTKKLAQK